MSTSRRRTSAADVHPRGGGRGALTRGSRARRLVPALLLAACAWPAAAAAQRATPTVVYVVRHAEKADDGSSDPALTAAGEARARVLAERLASVDLAAVFATQFQRTRATAAPAARAAGVAVTVQEARSGRVAEDARALAERIRAEHQGRSILVVGHSNTVPAFLEALSGASPGEMGEHDHDDLFIVELPWQGAPRGTREMLGTPTPDPAPTASAAGAAAGHHPQPSPSPTSAAEVGGTKSIATAIEAVIEARGLEVAVQAYQELTRYSKLSYDFSERELEGLGRRYLEQGEALKAAVVFELNAGSHQGSPSVFLSLGEAYRALDERERALAVYRHVLKMEPGNEEARRALAELEGR
ncbi:MAG TPA: histidine phosphatase family protein [Longimicrobiales bacterium]|nr:histidine phosphatase family protein [Longimicrobiales bacterium]